MDSLLSVDEATKILGTSARVPRRLIAERHIRFVRVGRHMRLPESELAQPTRRGTLIDSLRGRLVVPVTRPHEQIDGSIGPYATGEPRAPKYRNPTRTPTFDKSNVLYTPTGRVPRDATLVVEGALDALAITAAASTSGRPVAAVVAGGVKVARAQANLALALRDQPLVLALDGDPTAGAALAPQAVTRTHRPIGGTP